jgi:hypothetical protein
MSMFDYVMVLASVIIGLTLTQLLQGVARIVQRPQQHRVYWVHLVWVAILFVTAVLWWWWEFKFVHEQVWTIELYLFVLCFAVVLYFFGAVLFPHDLEGYAGYKDYYYARRDWIFGLYILFTLFDVTDTLAKGTGHFISLGWQYPVAMAAQCILSVAAIVSRNEKLHGAVAIIVLVYNLASALTVLHTVQ